MIVNGITLKKFLTYTNSVYQIDEKFKELRRKNCKAKTKAQTVAKTLLASLICGHQSINELNNINRCKSTSLKMLYNKNEYVPQTHGLRDCTIDTDWKQLEKINNAIIQKSKENKVFRNNKVDGLTVMAWDGVDLTETKKNIKGLPEKEYDDGIRKYVKYVCAMNVGPRANIMVASKQLLEVDKILTSTGKERAKTIGETKVFEEMWKETEKAIGSVIDVHVFDALYLNQNVTNLINKAGKYFVIRLKDETREIYKDAKGLFESRKADNKYEIVEHIVIRNIKYSKEAKKKNQIKTKTTTFKREITNSKLNERKLINEYIQEKKNGTVKVTEYEKVIVRKETWDDEFELTGYKGKVRVIGSKETSNKNQEIYVVTNMLDHDVETVLKIMHLRWNIENCGFRTIKQRYNLEHIFIGELNAINYIVQMIFMAFNLLELYQKIRLKNGIDLTWKMITRIFEKEYHSNKIIKKIYCNSS